MRRNRRRNRNARNGRVGTFLETIMEVDESEHQPVSFGGQENAIPSNVVENNGVAFNGRAERPVPDENNADRQEQSQNQEQEQRQHINEEESCLRSFSAGVSSLWQRTKRIISCCCCCDGRQGRENLNEDIVIQ